MGKAQTKKIRITHLRRKKRDGSKIVAITAYDWTVASIVDGCGVDVVLVGDSLGNVVQGLESTVPVRMRDMEYHTRIVSGAVRVTHVCADMPFLSYQAGNREAVKNAGILLKAGAESVKIEVGARRYIKTVRRITDAGIPVAAHIGLCPQSVNLLGGYGVQGNTPQSAQHIYDMAVGCRDSGAAMLFLECVPPELASRITSGVDIPVIGIGSGAECDGQVLVFNDMVGLTGDSVAGFVKQYAEARKMFADATERYAYEVREGIFPAPEGKK